MPNVKVRITTETAEQTQGGAEQVLDPSKKDIDKKKMATTSLFAHAIVGNVKQIVNYGLRNYGNFTGDYLQQERINASLETFGDLSTIALGGVSGGLPGLVVATASIGVRRGLQLVTTFQGYRLETLNSQLSRERSGNALWSNSRGTED